MMKVTLVFLLYAIAEASCSTFHDVLASGKATSRITTLVESFHTTRTRMESEVPVWVFFADKGPSHNYNSLLENVEKQLHPKALWRRRKTNGNVVDHTDLPVHTNYINGVLATGVKLRSTSKWLNAISVSLLPASEEQLHVGLLSLVSLSYVKSIDVVATLKREPQMGSDHTKRISEYNGFYGESYDQLQQINVVQAHSQGYNGSGIIVMIADTGYLKTHPALPMDRVLAEYDFVANDPDTGYEGDTHGTATFSNLGGWAPGTLIGSGFGAHFLLAKTEDTKTETIVEEDNFVSALQWGEGLGADIVSASLGYSNWYVYADMDGDVAPITKACDLAFLKGVVVVVSNGNSGKRGVSAPADGFNVLSVGAVNSEGGIASFSSVGPTSDGRMKPDVCARGVDNIVADAQTGTGYKHLSGTSFSCPLTAGVVAILLQAHPDWTPAMVVEALRNTASLSYSPNIDFGWGIIDTMAALNYTPKTGDCDGLACEHGSCDDQCRCDFDYYGSDCNISRVACDNDLCSSRGGYCQVPNEFRFQCGKTPAPVGCDNIPYSDAVLDACGICNGNNQSCLPKDVPTSSSAYYIMVGVVCFVSGVIATTIAVVGITYFKRRGSARGQGFRRLDILDDEPAL